MGGLLGGGARASKKAGAIQQQAANGAADSVLAANMANQALAQPRMNFSNEAMPQLRGLLGLAGGDANAQMEALKNTPGYQFKMNEGMRAMEGGAAARGMLFSGKNLIDNQDFGARIAGDTRQQEIANLMSLYGDGNGILSQLMGGNSQSASTAGQLRVGGAQAMGQGMIGAAAQRGAGINEFIRGIGSVAGKWGF